MITWLHHIDDIWVFCILTFPLVFLVIGASVLSTHWNSTLHMQDDDGFQIMDAFIAVASAAAVVLAFSLVQVDTGYRALEDTLTKEASAVNALDRVMLRYNDPALAPARAALLDYARTLAHEEWRLLIEGGRSDNADAQYVTVSKTLRAIDPITLRQGAMFTEALKVLDDVADLRELRISAGQNGLPALFWKSVLAIFLLLVLIASQTKPTTGRLWAMAAVSATLGLLLSLVVIVDAPFAGESSLKPDALERVIRVMSMR